MDNYSKIREVISKMKSEGSPFLLGEVLQVSGDSCSVKVGDLTLTDVRLRAVLNNNDTKIVISPKIGSQVIVCDISGNTRRNMAVIFYSEIDKVNLKIDNTEMEATNSGIVFNGGNNGGMVNIRSIVNNLNNIKTYLEQLNTALSTCFGAVDSGIAAVGGAGSSATTFQTSTAALNLTFEDMEDTKVKH